MPQLVGDGQRSIRGLVAAYLAGLGSRHANAEAPSFAMRDLYEFAVSERAGVAAAFEPTTGFTRTTD